jgi:predicted nucleotidyltransferase
MAVDSLPGQLLGDERAALEDLVGFVRRRYGKRVQDLRLFGSRARGEGHEESDVDVLVVVDDLTADERMEVWHYTGRLLDTHDVMVGAFVLPTARWEELCARDRLIAREIQRDGIPL